MGLLEEEGTVGMFMSEVKSSCLRRKAAVRFKEAAAHTSAVSILRVTGFLVFKKAVAQALAWRDFSSHILANIGA